MAVQDLQTIIDDYRAGRISRSQAELSLKVLGFKPDQMPSVLGSVEPQTAQQTATGPTDDWMKGALARQANIKAYAAQYPEKNIPASEWETLKTWGMPMGNYQASTSAAGNAGGATLAALKEEIRKLLAAGNRDGAIKTAQNWFRLNSTTGTDPMAEALAFVNSMGPTSVTRAATSSAGQADIYRTDAEGNPLGQRTAEEARREEFGGSEEGRRGLFQDVLRKMVGNYDYDSPALRRGYESRIPGLEATYALDPALRGEAGAGKAPSWQDFLRSGRSAMTPNAIQAAISRIGGLGGPIGQQSLHDQALVNQFRSGGKSDEAAFSTMVDPYLGNVDPMMRDAYARALSQQFQRMRLEQPDKSFAQQLKEMGGRLF